MKTLEQLERMPHYLLEYFYDKCNGESTTFNNEDAANAAFSKILDNLLNETKALESKHWNNNSTGLQVTLYKVESPTGDTLHDMLACETDEELSDMWQDYLHNEGVQVSSSSTYLSDEWDNSLGKKR